MLNAVKSRYFSSGKKFIYTLAFVLILHLTFNIENCLCQWQPDVRLTTAEGNSYTSLNNAWCIAACGNVVHTVWYDSRDGDYNEIYYKRSTNDGINWGPGIRLTYNASESRYPSIAVSGSLVHTVWFDSRDGNWEIYYKRSTDGGITWGADIRLTNSTSAVLPSIAVSGSLVHVVWGDDRHGNEEIYYKHSTDDGITWGADMRLTNNSSSSYDPSVAVSGSIVHVVLRDNRDGNYEIYYKSSTDAGVSWGADTRLTNNTSISRSSSIAVSGSFVHVVWCDYRDGDSEIYYKRSTDGGITWGIDTRLTYNITDSEYPSIAVSGSLVHVVWFDNRDGNSEIYYKRSTDSGINWETDTRLTNNTFHSENPSIAFSGSIVHVVWEDTRNGYYNIYYKRNPTGNVGIQNISTEIPSSYSLEQNYPNPFNPITKIKFEIPDRSPIGAFGDDNVVLKVFDLLGKENATLVNEQLAPGTYETNWNASNHPSGIYFYKLETVNYSETKKMILIR